MWFPNLSGRNPQRPWWVILTEDGPPWIYAEHTPNKKCREHRGNQKLTERSERCTSGVQIWEINIVYWQKPGKCWLQVKNSLLGINVILSTVTATAAYCAVKSVKVFSLGRNLISKTKVWRHCQTWCTHLNAHPGLFFPSFGSLEFVFTDETFRTLHIVQHPSMARLYSIYVTCAKCTIFAPSITWKIIT